MNNWIRRIYIFLLCALCFFMMAGILHGATDDIDRSSRIATREVTPDSEVELDATTKLFTLSIDPEDSISLGLEFYTNHQFVDVFADRELIYSLYPKESVYGVTSGSCYNFVELPADCQTVEVKIHAAYSSVTDREYHFLIGDPIQMYKTYLYRSIPSMFLSALCVCVGFFMMGYYALMHKKVQQGPSLLYFGATVTILSLWCLNETEFATLLINNRTVASFIGYILMMLIPIPFTQYIRKNFLLEDKALCAIICILSIVDMVACTVLHMRGILAFKQTAGFTHLVLVLSLLYMLYAIVWHARRFGFDRLSRVHAIALAIFAVSMGVDVFSFYEGLENTDVLARIGVLIYIVLVGREGLSTYTRRIDEGRKAEMYREMAITDAMTGLYNRGAFDQHVADIVEPKGYMVITYDLNELKHCNDTFGHVRGDQYLIDAANLIRANFESIGNSYRIGGDEFATIVPGGEVVQIEHYLKRFSRQQDEYNALSRDIRMHIAVGFAIYDETIDSSIETVRIRADRAMYECKERMKQA